MYPSVSLLRYSIKQSISQSIVKFGIGLTMLRTPRGHLQTVCKCQLSGMSRHDSVNKSVLSRVQKVARDGTDVTSGGRQFHTWASNRKCSAANGGTVNRKLDEAQSLQKEWSPRRLGRSTTQVNGPRYDGAQSWRPRARGRQPWTWRSETRSQRTLMSAPQTWSARSWCGTNRGVAIQCDTGNTGGVLVLLRERAIK